MRHDEELERFVMAHSPRLHSILEASPADSPRPGISHEDFWREMEAEPLETENANAPPRKADEGLGPREPDGG
jgi:hypothetical protein